MKTRLIIQIALLACIPFFDAQGAPVTNWHTFKATTATTLSGQGTSSPVFGTTSLSSSTAVLIGYMDAPLSLVNVGDRITFSYNVSFNDAVGIPATTPDQFRFALYDLNGETRVAADNTTGAAAGTTDTDNLRGYWFGVKSGSGAQGSMRKRTGTTADVNPFANASAGLLGTAGGTSITYAGATNGVGGGAIYSGTMILELQTGSLAVAGFFAGNGGTNVFTYVDASSPLTNNYESVGFLSGGSLSCDQMLFQNMQVAFSAYQPVQITSQPTNVQALAGQSATFQVSWTNGPAIPMLQWRENGIDIPSATNAIYTITNTSPSQDQNVYSVVINNLVGANAVSSNATLTVVNDLIAPTVLSASSLVSNSVNVIFSEAVDPTTSQDSSSYSLAGNTIASVLLLGTTNVLITFDNPITGNYSLTVTNVKDISGNVVATTNVAGIAHGFEASIGIGISDGVGFAFNDKPVVHAGGSDIFNTTDQFQYVYKSVSGDFDLAVRIESLLNTDANAKAGLMARVNTFFDSRNIMIEATPARFIMQYRTNAAGNGSFAVASPRPATAFPNCWVRLVRSGPLFTAYSSTNSGTWDLIGSYDTTIDAEGAYPGSILVGLAATSHNTNSVTKAVFSGFGQALVTPTLSIAKIGGNVELSWSPIGFNLQATPSLTAPITWTNVPASSLTNRVVLPASSSASFYRLQQ